MILSAYGHYKVRELEVGFVLQSQIEQFSGADNTIIRTEWKSCFLHRIDLQGKN